MEQETPSPTTADRIRRKCDQVAELLVAKNQAYGDSALHPVAIFGRGKASDLIRVRIDDKLSRIRNNPEAFGEDPVLDLLGYLVLLSLALEDEDAARAIYDRDAKKRQKAGGKVGREKQLGGVRENFPEAQEVRARDQAGKAVGAATRPAGDRHEPAQQLPSPFPGHLAGVGMAERLCRESQKSLTGRRPIG